MSSIKLPKIVQDAVVLEMINVEAPSGVEAVRAALMKQYTEHAACCCDSCVELARGVAVDLVVLDETLKMTPPESEAGVASLMYRLHRQHARQLDGYLRLLSAIRGEAALSRGEAALGPLPERSEAIRNVVLKLIGAIMESEDGATKKAEDGAVAEEKGE